MGYYSDQEQRDIIARNLSAFIELSGKEQKRIAMDLDVNPPTLNAWVRGISVPSVSMLKKVAKYFNVTLSAIIDDDVEPFKTVSPTDDELLLLYEFRRCSPEIKRAINTLLNVPKEKDDVRE